MKWLNLLAVSAALSLGGVNGVPSGLSSQTCEEADRKIAASGYGVLNEERWLPMDATTLTVLPEGCTLPSTDVFGAWYKVNIPGSANLTLDSNVFTRNGIDADQTVSVMEGSCGALTCVRYANAVANGAGRRDATAVFNLKANTDYFVFFTVAIVPGAGVPEIGMKLNTPEADCKYFRSDQITNAPYSDGGLGACTPCASSATGDSTYPTVWTTTCFDPCPHCYNGPFCYIEQRNWNHFVPAAPTVDTKAYTDIDLCYNFTDGNDVVCDQGSREGACPELGLSINGVTCGSCEQQYNQTTCLNDFSLAYGNFKADCSNVGDGSGLVDKCTNTGFDASPALYNYGKFTDIILANQYGVGAVTPSYQGQCNIYEEEGFPQVTMAPTAAPVLDAPIVLNMDDRSDEFDVAQNQNVLFTMDVSSSTGIVACEVRGDNGDIDLYVGVDMLPLGVDYVGCKSTLYGSDEACSVLVDGAFEVHVIAEGYRAATEATVKCELTDLSDARDFKVDVDVKKDFDLDASEFRLYKMEVPDNTARVSCDTSADDGDLDLWFRVGALPQPYVEGRYDCISNSYSGNEYCELQQDISNNDLYILLEGRGNVTNGELKCAVTLQACGDCLYTDDAEEIKLKKKKSGWSLLENENKLFTFRVPKGTKKVWCDVEPKDEDSDVDLFLRIGEVPVTTGSNFQGGVFDCASISENGIEHCEHEWGEDTGAPQEVSVYALVNGYEATSNIDIKCDGDVPLTKDDAERIRSDRTFGTDLDKNEEVLVYIEIEEGTDEMTCTTKARDGDVDIFSKKDRMPQSSYGNDQRDSEGGGNRHEIRWEFSGGLDDGAYGDEEIYILLVAFEKTRDVELLCIEIYFELEDTEAGKKKKVKKQRKPKLIRPTP